MIVYELLGPIDALMRAWLPEGCVFEDVNRTLEEELDPAGLRENDSFQVDCMVRHWPFMKADGSTDGPEDQWLLRLQDSEIDEVEKGWPEVRSDLLVRLESQHLLASMRPHASERPGIKFAIEVESQGSSDVRRLADLEQRLVEILERADHIAQRSLYSGSGFAEFLILGRVDYEDFHSIHSDLISEINRASLGDGQRTLTQTHVSGQRGYRIAKEGLSGNGHDGRFAAFLRRRLPTNEDVERRLEPGEDFGGRYRIEAYLGKGGFADVYRAYDQFERVDRALKIFRPSNRESALREMAALRKVNHPNVVKAIWYDQDGPLSYLVTEFIEGKSLDEIPPRAITGRSDIWALSVLIETLQGLQAVHPDDERVRVLRSKGELEQREFIELQAIGESGLVHRDIKPQNLMVGEDGHVTIVDFNIASPAYDQGTTRESGTPEYMAPDGGDNGWQPTDDLFSCGVVLYELLLGEHPFPGRRPKGDLKPTDPRSLRPDLPEPLALLLERACMPLRADRFRSAAEMARELIAVKAGIEELEEEVRQALLQWRQGHARADPVAPGGSVRSDTQESIRLARILVDHVDEFPSESKESSTLSEQSTSNGDGTSRDEPVSR